MKLFLIMVTAILSYSCESPFGNKINFNTKVDTPNEYGPLELKKVEAEKIGVDGTVKSVVEDDNYIYVGGVFTHIGQDLGGVAVFDAKTREVVSSSYYDGPVVGAVSDREGGFLIYGLYKQIDGKEQSGFSHLLKNGFNNPSFFAGYEDLGNGLTSGNPLHGLRNFPSDYAHGRGFNEVGVDTKHKRFFTVESDPSGSGDVVLRGRKLSDGSYDSVIFRDIPYCLESYGFQYKNIFVFEDKNLLVFFSGSGNPYFFDLKNGGAPYGAGHPDPSAACDFPGRAQLVASKDGRTFYRLGENLLKFTYNPVTHGLTSEELLALEMDSDSATVVKGVLSLDEKNIFILWYSKVSEFETKIMLSAVDLDTKEIKDFNPTNETINDIAINPLDKCLYVVGDFEKIGGKSKQNIACLNEKTGEAHSFSLNTGRISKITVSDLGDKILLGGSRILNHAVKRSNLAVYSKKEKQATSFNPNLNGGEAYGPISKDIYKLLVRDQKLFVSGGFTKVGNLDQRYFAAFDIANNFSLLPAMGPVLPNVNYGMVRDMDMDSLGEKLVFHFLGTDVVLDRDGNEIEENTVKIELMNLKTKAVKTVVDMGIDFSKDIASDVTGIKVSGNDQFFAYSYSDPVEGDLKIELLDLANDNDPIGNFSAGGNWMIEKTFQISKDSSKIFYLHEDLDAYSFKTFNVGTSAVLRTETMPDYYYPLVSYYDENKDTLYSFLAFSKLTNGVSKIDFTSSTEHVEQVGSRSPLLIPSQDGSLFTGGLTRTK